MRALIPLLVLIGAASCAGAPPQPPAAVPRVSADFETEPVASRDDAADDSVILAEGGFVRIVGTDKQAGLVVYDLDGARVEFLEAGRLNNVDAVRLENGRFLIAASNRTHISIDLFELDPTVGITNQVGRIPLALEELSLIHI